jgi:hypothetical protein
VLANERVLLDLATTRLNRTGVGTAKSVLAMA